MKTEIRHSVEQLLSETGALCDTGYAYALHIRFTRPSFMYRTYPQSWISRYDEKGMIIEDPVVKWGLSETGLRRWSDLEDPDGILADAAAHGLTNGLTCAVGPSSSRSIAGFTRSDRAFSDDEAEILLGITEKLHQLTQQAL
ncbi:autoinducer binding domain-containing protein [Thioclava sp.]|uniref:autoinducer binding domain-containing protein n=1 Tax=Thioclava sp. TaxID=1933450 RepID=UPI003AA84855